MIAFARDEDDVVERALDFARRAHFGQTRKGPKKEPYVNHCKRVAELVRQAGGTLIDIASALLHDVPEDTGFNLGDIYKMFGGRVSGTLFWLINPEYFSQLDPVEKKRQQAIRLGYGPDNVRLIRLSDIISNLESLAHDPPVEWSYEKCFNYLAGTTYVATECKQVSASLYAQFLEIHKIAYDETERAMIYQAA